MDENTLPQTPKPYPLVVNETSRGTNNVKTFSIQQESNMINQPFHWKIENNKQLRLRFEPGEHIPVAGESTIMEGFAGTYVICISRVICTTQHPTDGATLLDVRATRILIAPPKQEIGPATLESETEPPSLDYRPFMPRQSLINFPPLASPEMVSNPHPRVNAHIEGYCDCDYTVLSPGYYSHADDCPYQV